MSFEFIEFKLPEHVRDREAERRAYWTVRFVDSDETDFGPALLGASCGPYAVDALTQDGKRCTLACRKFSEVEGRAPQCWYWPSNRLDEGIERLPTREEIVAFLLRCMAEHGDKPSRDVMRVYDGTWHEQALP